MMFMANGKQNAPGVRSLSMISGWLFEIALRNTKLPRKSFSSVIFCLMGSQKTCLLALDSITSRCLHSSPSSPQKSSRLSLGRIKDRTRVGRQKSSLFWPYSLKWLQIFSDSFLKTARCTSGYL